MVVSRVLHCLAARLTTVSTVSLDVKCDVRVITCTQTMVQIDDRSMTNVHVVDDRSS